MTTAECNYLSNLNKITVLEYHKHSFQKYKTNNRIINHLPRRLKNILNFIWKTYLERGVTEILHLLGPSPNSHNGWGWAHSKPGVKSFLWVSHISVSSPSTGAVFWFHRHISRRMDWKCSIWTWIVAPWCHGQYRSVSFDACIMV